MFKLFTVLSLLIVLLSIPTIVLAAAYNLQAPLPGLNAVNTSSTSSIIAQYINPVYRVAVILCLFLAVGAIVVGGYIYMVAGGNQEKVALGKDIIFNALIGLGLALVSYLLLYTINPTLTSTNGFASNFKLNTNAGLPSAHICKTQPGMPIDNLHIGAPDADNGINAFQTQCISSSPPGVFTPYLPPIIERQHYSFIMKCKCGTKNQNWNPPDAMVWSRPCQGTASKVGSIPYTDHPGGYFKIEWDSGQQKMRFNKTVVKKSYTGSSWITGPGEMNYFQPNWFAELNLWGTGWQNQCCNVCAVGMDYQKTDIKRWASNKADYSCTCPQI